MTTTSNGKKRTKIVAWLPSYKNRFKKLVLLKETVFYHKIIYYS